MPALPQIGAVYGRWTVVATTRSRGTHRYYVCGCECGAAREVREYVLTSATTTTGCRSCATRDKVTTHGGTGTFEFRAWTAMRKRCYYTKHPHYELYGGRGISVCAEWRGSFSEFLLAMGECPFGSAGSLDRINANGNYTPDNCRWVLRSAQAKNRRCVPLYNGMTLPELATTLGVKYTTLKRRIAAGWPPEKLGLSPADAGTRKR